jgi:hypothetical protein
MYREADMNALVNFEDRRNAKRKLRRAAAHDRCLYTFNCSQNVDDDAEVSDNRLRLKGFLNFIDSFVDPMAGTGYLICSGPTLPESPAAYFEQVGKHMAIIMHTPGGALVAGPQRRVVKGR